MDDEEDEDLKSKHVTSISGVEMKKYLSKTVNYPLSTKKTLAHIESLPREKVNKMYPRIPKCHNSHRITALKQP